VPGHRRSRYGKEGAILSTDYRRYGSAAFEGDGQPESGTGTSSHSLWRTEWLSVRVEAHFDASTLLPDICDCRFAGFVLGEVHAGLSGYPAS
jgi:hypothetical protein